ncbi:related to cysteine synthase [Zygosaccharomyces bailii ISA1307]|nr:related to cysteine synthase [Zygosaccharomyces bailii ISA1307]
MALMKSTWKDTLTVISALIAVYSSWQYYQAARDKDTPPVKKGIEQLIGNTPLVLIKSLSKATEAEIYAKMELCNPGGSAKDRVAYNVIKEAEEKGMLVRGEPGWVFEGTSGSTGISIALLCNALGYRAHISLPDDTSNEKLALLESLGATVNKVKPASIVDPNQYVNAAKRASEELTQRGGKGIFADQFENEANWRIHYGTTGPEIFKQMRGKLDGFVAGCGTGGTIAGVSKFLKERISTRVVLADPQGSGFFNRINYGVMYDKVEKEGTRRRHQVDTMVEGVGLNRITKNFEVGEYCVDESIRVPDTQAVKMAKFLSVQDGLFVGSSTAINAVAAVKLARDLGPGCRIVMIACDSGSRHLSKFWKIAKDVDRDITLNQVME